jgi:elongation factor P
VAVLKKPLQYLYQDQDGYVFMDQKSFEQVTLPAEVIGEEAGFLKEGGIVDVLFHDEEPLTVDLPAKMTFKVTEAAPGEKGDSASNVYKDAKLENGLNIRVPLFINVGDFIRVDTRDKSYIERVRG